MLAQGLDFWRPARIAGTLSSERSRKDCPVAKNSNADRITALCFTACPQIGVLWSSDDTLCNFTWGLSPQRRWEHARHTASRHSASLPVHEMVFCSLLMTLSSATSHEDFQRQIQTKTTHQRPQPRARDTSSSSLPPQRPQYVAYAV